MVDFNERQTFIVASEEYKELIRKAERIAILERLSESKYLTTSDIFAILGIERKDKENGEL